ncbi:MAG: hypothetical protein HQK55_05475, partial [Deltaproteobacteria bacterium]|nr:hypothetical protein [Deltaproteobacteria bacterium]
NYMFLLNNHVLCHATWLSPLVLALAGDSNLGAVTSNLLLPSSPPFFPHDLRRPDLKDLYFVDLSILGVGRYRTVRAASTHPRIVSGCALLTRRDIINHVGGLFDETLQMYVEDTDFSLRLVNMGYKLLAVRDSLLYHLHGTDTELSKKRVLTAVRAIRNRVLVYFKNMSSIEFFLFFPLLFFGGPMKLLELPFSRLKKVFGFVAFSFLSFIAMFFALFAIGEYLEKRRIILEQRRGDSFHILRHLFKNQEAR